MLFFETGGGGGGFVFKLWEQLPHTEKRKRESDWGWQREREKHYISALVKRNVGSLQWDALNSCEKTERGGVVLFIQSHSFRRVLLMTPVQTLSITLSVWKGLSLQKTTGGGGQPPLGCPACCNPYNTINLTQYQYVGPRPAHHPDTV